jgi:protein-disulfide isomerase
MKRVISFAFACVLIFYGQCFSKGSVKSVEDVKINFKATDLALSKNGRYAYVLSQDNRLHVFKSGWQEVASFPLPKGVTGIRVADRDDEIFVIDREGRLKTIKLNFPKDIDTANSPFRGNPKAPLEIVVFSDFECPHCSNVAKVLDRISEKFKDKVKIVFKHCPLGYHKSALEASQAAIAAGIQGKFWEYHDLLFEHQKELTPEKILELASALAGLGASLSRFLTDLLAFAAREAFGVGEGLSQGSSFMPQKHNPVVLEHARIYAGRLLGGYAPLALLNHNTPFTDLNDHSTGVLEPLAEMLFVAEAAVELTRVALEEGGFLPERLLAEFSPEVLASEAVDLLVRKGVPLPEAYRRVRGALPGLRPELLGVEREELLAWMDLEAFFARREVLGGVGPRARTEALSRAKKRLRADRKALAALRARVRLSRRWLQDLQPEEGQEGAQEEGQVEGEEHQE